MAGVALMRAIGSTGRHLMLALILFFSASAIAASSGYYYTVQRNDSMTLIARRHDLSVAQLAQSNRLRYDAALVPGSRIWVPAAKPSGTSRRIGYKPPERKAIPRPKSAPEPVTISSSSNVYVVQKGDTLWGIANKYSLTVSQLASFNAIDPGKPLAIGQTLKIGRAAPRDIPGGGITTPASTQEVAAVTAPSQGTSARGYIWPAEGKVLRRFVNNPDEIFTGIDIAVPKGTEIRAARDGTVVYAGGVIPAYGRVIIIDHGGGIATCYGQLGWPLVREGQTVRRGQVIARSGENSRGDELLHFEIRRNGNAVDPEPYLP